MKSELKLTKENSMGFFSLQCSLREWFADFTWIWNFEAWRKAKTEERERKCDGDAGPIHIDGCEWNIIFKLISKRRWIKLKTETENWSWRWNSAAFLFGIWWKMAWETTKTRSTMLVHNLTLTLRSFVSALRKVNVLKQDDNENGGGGEEKWSG